ncbi:MAG: hypothetical protein HGA45_07185 [Chloroflexales bacterium]|nr:hypothetical protein [Chloroflexales bacterium]
MTRDANNLITAGLRAIATSAATSIDDIVLLTLRCSQTNETLRGRHIVAGQYLGFIALVAVSLLGFVDWPV